MKKTILSIAVIAAAIFAASCQKESLQDNAATEGSASVFTATIETVASTKTTAERVDGTPVVYKTKWDDGDEISINGTIFTATPSSDATKATFTKDSGNDPTGTFQAYFPANLCIKMKGLIVSLPATYSYAEGKYNMPMYAESDNTTLSFKNLCGVLAITVSGADFTSVSSIEVSSDQQMNGLFSATAEGVLSFASTTLTDDLKKVTLDASASPKTIESTGSATFYLPVPAGTHNPLTIKVSDGTTTKTMVTKKSGGVAVARNTVYPIAFADNSSPSLPDGALSGVFSVSATKKVYFSQGNLTCDISGATPDWKFYEHQYDYATGYDSDLISLFIWGYDATTSLIPDGNSQNFQSKSNEDLTQEEDWGSRIGDGKTWRTLTASELKFLFDLNSSSSGIRTDKYKYDVVVCGKPKCVVIAPDNWNLTLHPLQDEYSSTSSPLTWKQAEAAGLVCLPAAGRRTGNTVELENHDGHLGRYWTSSATQYSTSAFDLCFDDFTKLNPSGSGDRSNGYSVRLVTDMN